MSKWNNNNKQYQYRNNNSKSEASTPRRDMDGSEDKMYEKSLQKEPLTYANQSAIRALVKQSPTLLTDDQMISFIKNGYIALDCGLPKDYHQFIYNRAESLKLSRTNNDGNNILPVLPFLQDVYDSPNIRGALTSILGNDYMMHPHRHPHLSVPGFGGQQWHKDSYWGNTKHRSHVPRWVMAMYYPQDVNLSMGPTAIAANTAYLANPNTNERHWSNLPKGWEAKELFMECKAGTVVIIHYDIWHKATPNKSNINRYMFKFQFTRTEEPTQPTWNCTWKEPLTSPFDATPAAQAPVWTHVWNWLMGGRARVDAVQKARLEAPVDKSEIADLKQKLNSETPDGEPVRLWAAYKLGPHGLDTLTNAFMNANGATDAIWRNACYGLISLGTIAVPALLDLYSKSNDANTRGWILFALGEIGAPAAVATVENAMKEKSDFIARTAAEALGTVATDAKAVISLGNMIVKHANEQARFQATLSMLQVARTHGKAIAADDALKKAAIIAMESALDDSNRYVRGYAINVLRYLPFVEAQDLLMRELLRSRWDPLTTKNTQF